MATILVVDDKAINRELLRSVLSRTNHRLLEAENGAEGLGLAKVEHPELVVADILMPKMDGYSFVRELRTDSATRNCAVVFWTANYAEDEVRLLADRSGVKYILPKPAVPEVILDVVDKALSEGPQDISLVPNEEFRREHLALLNEKLLEQVRRLEESEARKTAILESALDAIVSMDHEGKIVEFNPGAERIFGYERTVVIGKPMADVIIPPTLREKHRRGLERYLATGEGRVLGERLELTGIRSDGTEFPIDLAIVRVNLPGPPLFTGFLRDITDRKASEVQLEAYALDLRRAAAAERERAAQLAQALDQLRRTHEALRRSDEERRALLTHLVKAQEEERRRIASDIHDDSIQTMAAAALRLGMLKGLITDPQQLKVVTKLEKTVQLTIGRLRHLLFQLTPPALGRAGLAAAIQEYLNEAFADSDTAFELEDAIAREPSPEIRTLIYRIAQEALSNVRKHAKASHVRVRLEDRDGGLMVSISDDGAGYEAEEAEERLPGHLGLVSMRERAEMLGGWFRIEGTRGAGTKVEFWLPGDARVGQE